MTISPGPCECPPYSCDPYVVAGDGTFNDFVRVFQSDGAETSRTTLTGLYAGSILRSGWDSGDEYEGGPVVDHEDRLFWLGNSGVVTPTAWRLSITLKAGRVNPGTPASFEIRANAGTTIDWDAAAAVGGGPLPEDGTNQLYTFDFPASGGGANVRLCLVDTSPTGEQADEVLPIINSNVPRGTQGALSEANFLLGDLSIKALTGTVTTCPEPKVGQQIFDELVGFGNGSTFTFTTRFPYSPQTLQVEVDGIVVSADPSNPSAGGFTFTFAPLDGEEIRVSYQANP